jgi:hypothetical protein
VGFKGASAVLFCGAALAACSGSAFAPSPNAIPAASSDRTALLGTAATPTPIPFAFQTVDDPASTVNAVRSINQSGQIVGTVGAGTSNFPAESYSSSSPYSSFEAIQYTNAADTVATSLSSTTSNQTVAGYLVSPPSLHGTWAFVRINGFWTVFKDRKEGRGADSVTEILGINDTKFAVGFYTNSYGLNVPVVINITSEKFNILKPPGAASAQGTGINDLNDILGWGGSSSSASGFFLHAGAYYTVAYPGAASTEALNLNKQDQVVGYYQGSNGVKHGFVLTGPLNGSSQVWQSVDDPNGVNGTVVTGINNGDDICGYYFDSSGVQHGFVATP